MVYTILTVSLERKPVAEEMLTNGLKLPRVGLLRNTAQVLHRLLRNGSLQEGFTNLLEVIEKESIRQLQKFDDPSQVVCVHGIAPIHAYIRQRFRQVARINIFHDSHESGVATVGDFDLHRL